MERLKKYIRKNRDSFDEKEPLEGHFDRFRYKLETRKPARKVNLFMVAAAAAIAGLILTGTLGILYNNSSLNRFNFKELSLSVISPELKEVENYYLGQINTRYDQIKSLKKNVSPEVESEVNKAIVDMDLGYYLLKKDLSKSPKQERIVSAMIQQYQIRVEMLDQILKSLQNINQVISKQ
jgi:hypothetical protein